MKIQGIRLLAMFYCISIFSCTKETKEIVIVEGVKSSKTSSVESLSTEDVAFWDNSESVDLDINELLLPNGMTFSQYKASIGKKSNEGENRNLLLMLLSEKANEIINYTNPGFTNTLPIQTKLAYSWNGKNYKNRYHAADGCPENLYGLDCSGFLYNVFTNAGFIGFKTGSADSQRQVPHIIDVLSNTKTLTNSDGKNIDLNNMVAKDYKKIPVTSMLTGDIIYWLDGETAKHIGILLVQKNGEVSVAQSNGKQNTECEENYKPMKGKTLSRGPRFTTNIANSIKSREEKGFGENYGIVRFLEKTPCNLKTISGGYGVIPTLHSIGNKSGTIQLTYEMFSVPDKLEVFYGNELLFSTKEFSPDGFVSGSNTKNITYTYEEKTGTEIEVIVTGDKIGTAWEYTVNCPE